MMVMEEEKRTWKCMKCNKELVKKRTVFTYLGHTFSNEVMCCPKCGKVFIPKELAEGKMAVVEQELEDK